MEQESQIDGTPTDQNPNNSGSHASLPPKIDNSLLYYDMTKNRQLLVFNHETYKKPSLFGESLPPRAGTDEDVKSLCKVFKSLKFNIVVYKDLYREQIIKMIKEFVAQDHRETSCVVVVILTHGYLGGELWAKDAPYNLNSILTMFEGGTLVTIPKVFMVQACRGNEKDAGQRIQLDGAGKASLLVPTHTDFLVLYSTVENYASFRDSRGSWMIQTFCRILSQSHQTLDLLHIITLVNSVIAHEYVSYSFDPSIHNKKQTSETKFTLTKLLKF